MLNRERRCGYALSAYFPRAKIKLLGRQGFCSCTYLVTESMASEKHQTDTSSIVQFRVEKHSLDITVAQSARMIYGIQAPAVSLIPDIHVPGMQVLRMELIPGKPYSEVAADHADLSVAEFAKQTALLRGFAAFVAKGWQSDRSRPDEIDGVIATLSHKLHVLARGLPTAQLRLYATQALESLDLL